jgi:signal transduction histidine kinase
MHRYDWAARLDREHPRLVDTAVVLVALVGSSASVWFVATLVPWPVALLLNGVPPLALAARRTPAVMTAVLAGTGLLQWGLAVPVNGAQVATLLAVWSVAVHGPAGTARRVLGLGLLLVAVAPFRQPYTGPTNTALSAGLIVVIHLAGSNLRLRREHLQALEDRAQRLERERDVATEVAAALERTRIARELHDVVAHQVSVMVVQAEGAGWALDGQPERARAAIATIAATGRATLVELRRLLGVLRSGDEDGVAPQPGLADLDALVGGFRSSGIQVSAEISVDGAGALPPGLQLAAYRIVQEGLTNTLKHAGPGTAVTVRVRRVDAAVTVEIRDDGTSSAPVSHPGHGLVGIRERAALFGGTARTGPCPGGGFQVLATLPVDGARS